MPGATVLKQDDFLRSAADFRLVAFRRKTWKPLPAARIGIGAAGCSHKGARPESALYVCSRLPSRQNNGAVGNRWQWQFWAGKVVSVKGGLESRLFMMCRCRHGWWRLCVRSWRSESDLETGPRGRRQGLLLFQLIPIPLDGDTHQLGA